MYMYAPSTYCNCIKKVIKKKNKTADSSDVLALCFKICTSNLWLLFFLAFYALFLTVLSLPAEKAVSHLPPQR